MKYGLSRLLSLKLADRSIQLVDHAPCMTGSVVAAGASGSAPADIIVEAERKAGGKPQTPFVWILDGSANLIARDPPVIGASGAGRMGMRSDDFGFLLHFNLGRQDRRRNRRNRNVSGFRAAEPIEDIHLVRRRDDLAERCQRRADQVCAANQFVRTSVDVDAIDHDGSYLERLRTVAAGQREPAGDIVEEKTELLALLLGLLDQHLAELRHRNRVGGLDHQVALTSDGLIARLLAAVPIGFLESGNRRPRKQEVSQDSIFDDRHRPRLHAFVVVGVVAVQIDGTDFLCCRIVDDRNEIGKDLLVDLFAQRSGLRSRSCSAGLQCDGRRSRERRRRWRGPKE